MISILVVALAAQTFTPDSGDVSVVKSRQFVRDYALCVVKKQPAEANTAVLSTVDNKTLMKAYPKVIQPDCLDGSIGTMAFAGDLYRYALADALIQKENVAQPLIIPAQVEPLTHFTPGPPPSATDTKGRTISKKKYAASMRGYATDIAYSQVSRFGECVVRANPSGALNVLKTESTTDAEATAMVALRPVLSACLPKGETLQLTKEVLRGTIALNYYRLSKAPRLQEAAR